MWLLDAATHELCEFFGSQIPPYAILSHTWGPPSEEVSFRELQDQPGRAKLKPGYSKIHAVCAEAIEHRYRYTWVDSCCIDKSSSAELSEAINSMFKWYQSAGVCMVHLSDVTFSDGPELADAFERSRWFRRGVRRLHRWRRGWPPLPLDCLPPSLTNTPVTLPVDPTRVDRAQLPPVLRQRLALHRRRRPGPRFRLVAGAQGGSGHWHHRAGLRARKRQRSCTACR